jgi:glycosyltransferase involved in cell wall biosynthesis
MKVFFLGEVFRADAQTWIKGLKEYGDAEVVSWELPSRKGPFSRVLRTLDWLWACLFLRRKIKQFKPDIVLAYRITSYGFLGAWAGIHPLVVSQQGITDVWPPDTFSTPFKALIGKYALKKADLIHAWGEVMVPAMIELKADASKIKVMPKGIDIKSFVYHPEDKRWDKIIAIVTRSLAPDYRHQVILKAAKILKDINVPIEIYMIGGGERLDELKELTAKLGIEDMIYWKGRIANNTLPEYLCKSNMYLSVPITEGVSASLFEAMASGAFPVVTDLPGNSAIINHAENGYLVEVDNPEMLAQFIQKAWENKDLMKQACLKNRSYVEEYACYQKNMPIFVSAYRKLIAQESRNIR